MYEFDALRGFSMVLVVMGHVLLSMNLGGYDTLLSSALLTFRMPLFFFVSGFFAYRSVGKWTSEFTRSMLVRKFRAQVICTLIFFALLAYASGGDPLGWVESGFGGYWFTVVLFQMFLCYTLLSLLGRKCGEGFTIAGMALISAAGLGVLVAPFPKEGWLWTLLCWENVAKYFQFFTLGIVCRKYEAAFCRACSSDRMKTLAIVAYVACMCLWYSDSFRAWNGVAYRMVHDVVARYAGLGMVVTLFYSARGYFRRNGVAARGLGLVGRRTLDIYMLHYFLIPPLAFLGELLAPEGMLLLQLLAALALSLCIVAVCLLLSGMLRSSDFLSVWLFGMRPAAARKTSTACDRNPLVE